MSWTLWSLMVNALWYWGHCQSAISLGTTIHLVLPKSPSTSCSWHPKGPSWPYLQPSGPPNDIWNAFWWYKMDRFFWETYQFTFIEAINASKFRKKYLLYYTTSLEPAAGPKDSEKVPMLLWKYMSNWNHMHSIFNLLNHLTNNASMTYTVINVYT